MKLDEAVALVEGCDSLSDLRQALQSIAEDYGFASYNFIDAGRPDLDVPYYLGTTGTEWETTYRDNQFVHVDPYIAKARRFNLPFDWASISLPKPRQGPRSGLMRLMDAAFSFGFKEGVIVPYHFRDHLGRIQSAVCVFYWKDSIKFFQMRMTEIRNELHLIVIYFMQRIIDINAVDKRNAHAIFRGQSVDAVQLTEKERDVLAWAARGKTSKETSTILSCSELTVDTHIRNALAKLNASNKTHAVARCIGLGLIDL